jgi:hypothetical protein
LPSGALSAGLGLPALTLSVVFASGGRTIEIVVVVIVEYCRADIAVAAGVGESGGVGLIPGLRRG